MAGSADKLGEIPNPQLTLPEFTFEITGDESLYFLGLAEQNDEKVQRRQFKGCFNGAELTLHLRAEALTAGYPTVDLYCPKEESGGPLAGYVPHLKLPLSLVGDVAQFGAVLYGRSKIEVLPEPLGATQFERVVAVHTQLRNVGIPEQLSLPYEILVDRLASPDWDSAHVEDRLVALSTTMYEVLKVYVHNKGLDFIPFSNRGEDVWGVLRDHFQTLAGRLQFYKRSYPDQWKSLSPQVREAEAHFGRIAALFEGSYGEAVRRASAGELDPKSVQFLGDYMAALSLLRLTEEKWKYVSDIRDKIHDGSLSEAYLEETAYKISEELSGIVPDRERKFGLHPVNDYRPKKNGEEGDENTQSSKRPQLRVPGERLFLPREINGQPVLKRFASLLGRFVAARDHLYGHELETNCVMQMGPLEGLSNKEIASLRKEIEQREKLKPEVKGRNIRSQIYNYEDQVKGCQTGRLAMAIDKQWGLGTRKEGILFLKRTPGFQTRVDNVIKGQRSLVLRAPPSHLGDYVGMLDAYKEVSVAFSDKERLVQDVALLERVQRRPADERAQKRAEADFYVATRVASQLFMDEAARRELARDIYWEHFYKEFLETVRKNASAWEEDGLADPDAFFASMTRHLGERLEGKDNFKVRAYFALHLHRWMKEHVESIGLLSEYIAWMEDPEQVKRGLPKDLEEAPGLVGQIVQGFLGRYGINPADDVYMISFSMPDQPGIEDLAIFNGVSVDTYLMRSVQKRLGIGDESWAALWPQLKSLASLEPVATSSTISANHGFIDLSGHYGLVFKRSLPGHPQAMDELLKVLNEQGPLGTRIKRAIIDGKNSEDPLALFFVAADEGVREALRRGLTQEEIDRAAQEAAQEIAAPMLAEAEKKLQEAQELVARPFVSENFEAWMLGAAGAHALGAAVPGFMLASGLVQGQKPEVLDIVSLAAHLVFVVADIVLAETLTDPKGNPGTGDEDLDTALVTGSYLLAAVGLGPNGARLGDKLLDWTRLPEGMRAFSCQTDGSDADGDGTVNLCDTTPYENPGPTIPGGGVPPAR